MTTGTPNKIYPTRNAMVTLTGNDPIGDLHVAHIFFQKDMSYDDLLEYLARECNRSYIDPASFQVNIKPQ